MMSTTIPVPRLLPSTIAFIAVLLVVKGGMLLHAAVFNGPITDAAMVKVAQAASETAGKLPAGRPVAGGAPPALSAPGPAPAARNTSAGAAPNKADATAAQVGSANAASDVPPQAALPTDPATAPAISQSERVLLQDLRQRRKELDARADALKAREAVLAASEDKISTRVGELKTLQQRLETLDSAQKGKEEAGWQGMAKLYEAMKPHDAATIFNDLSMPVLLQVLDRMKDAKAAAVMAAMNPDKARDVTAELARLRLGHDPAAGPDGAPITLAGS